MQVQAGDAQAQGAGPRRYPGALDAAAVDGGRTLESFEAILPALQRYSYPGLFGLLLACSFGFPFSKTLSLIAAGVLVSQGVGHLPAFMAVGLAGLVASDGIYYGLGYWGGERVLRRRFLSRRVSLEALREAELRYRRQGWWAVFAARFTPFVRVVVFLAAGLSRMSPRRFFLADALSAALYVVPLCLAGYHFSENRRRIYQAVRESEALLAGLVLLGAACLAAWVLWKRRARRKM